MSRGVFVAHVEYISPAAYFPCSEHLSDLLQEQHGYVGRCYTAAGKDNKVAVVGETGDVGFAVMLEHSSGVHRESIGLLEHSNHSALGTSG